MATTVSVKHCIYILKLRSETQLYNSSIDDEMIIDAIAKETDFKKEDIKLIRVETYNEHREI